MKSILFAKNTAELFFQLKSNQELTIVGGCTELDELPEYTCNVYGNLVLQKTAEEMEEYMEYGDFYGEDAC